MSTCSGNLCKFPSICTVLKITTHQCTDRTYRNTLTAERTIELFRIFWDYRRFVSAKLEFNRIVSDNLITNMNTFFAQDTKGRIIIDQSPMLDLAVLIFGAEMLCRNPKFQRFILEITCT